VIECVSLRELSDPNVLVALAIIPFHDLNPCGGSYVQLLETMFSQMAKGPRESPSSLSERVTYSFDFLDLLLGGRE